MAEPMTPDDLVAHVRGLVDSSVTGWNSQIAAERARLAQEVAAKPYGNESEGRSGYVSSDISDTVQWIMPSLMEMFTSGERVVEFQPQGEEDEQAAEQESDVLNHLFIAKNEGFLVLWQWFQDALTQFNGILQVSWDTKREVTIEEYGDLSDDEMTLLAEDLKGQGKEVAILGHAVTETEELQQVQDPNTGQPIEMMVPVQRHRIKLRVVQSEGCLSVEPVPPEEFMISSNWRKPVPDGAPFCGRRTIKTRSDLVEMGYDPLQVEDLSGDGSLMWAPERTARHSLEAMTDHGLGEDDLELITAYVRVDYDGDGIAELRRVVMVGTEVLRWADGTEDNEEVDYNPFVSITPWVMSHRFYGDCIANQISDLQRLRSDLIRSMLDQIHMVTFPPVEVSEAALGDYTIDDLLNRGPDSIIRSKNPGMIREIVMAPAIQHTLPAIQFVDQERQNRTGVSGMDQSISPNALVKSATEAQQLYSQSQKKIVIIGRIFAETGVKALFAKMHRLVRRYGTRELAVKLRNTWVTTNPREWANRTDLQVAVGLGTGSKSEQFGMLMQVLGLQQQALPTGMCTPQQIKHTLDKLVQLAGFKNPDLFFTDPSLQPPADPGPSPEELLARAEQDKADVQREKAMLDDDRQRDKQDDEFDLANLELLAKYGMQVDPKHRQARIDAQRQQAMRADRDAEVSSQIRLEQAKRTFAAIQPPGPANAA